MTNGGIGSHGHIHTDEHKEYMSKTLKGRVFTKESIELRVNSLIKNKKGWKRIDQYDSTGKYIATYESIRMAAIKIKSNAPNISACLSGRQKSVKGFVFKYSI